MDGGSAACTRTAGESVAGSPYTITCAPGTVSAANYNFVTGDTAGTVTVGGSASCTRTAGESVAGSPYTIICAPGTLSAANYNFVNAYTVHFTITKATLSVNAVADTKVYGADDPSFAHTLSGVGKSDPLDTSHSSGSSSCTRTEGENVAGSPYTITCAPGTLSAANYKFVTGDTADFTITKA